MKPNKIVSYLMFLSNVVVFRNLCCIKSIKEGDWSGVQVDIENIGN